MCNFTHSHAAMASQQRHDTHQPIERKPSMAECRRCVCGADTQESDRACLKVNNDPTSFITLPSGQNSIEFHHTADDADRHIRAHLTTILGSLRCHSDIQLVDGKALLLKYVNCNDVTGYQAANSFPLTVTPLEPEMIFELASTKVCWTDKMTLLFRPPFPAQTDSHKVYQLYLQQEWKMTSPSSPGCALITPPPTNRKRMTGTDTWQESSTFQFLIPSTSISIWLCITLIAPPTRCAIQNRNRCPRPFNSFCRRLCSSPKCGNPWTWLPSSLSTRATRNISSTRSWPTFPLLHDVLHLWRMRVVTRDVSDLSALSINRLYPVSALQRVILADITGALLYCWDVQDNPSSDDDQQSTSWRMYRVLPGKPGTGKSQVLIRTIHHATENGMSVLVTAPVALLAQGPHKIFLCDI